MLFFE
jgi:hypothetical protein